MTPIPMFKGVQDNGGHHGPCGVVFGEKGGFDDVYPGEKFGFHVVLMEWDESNAEERYEDLSKFAGLVGVGVATIATQGSTLSDPVAIKAAYDGGAKVGEMLPKIMASWDGDDFLGEQMVVLTYDSIAAEIQPWYERQMKAAKGGGQFLNQKGEPVSFIIKPWLGPQHQEMINLPGAVHFSEGGASYWLFYTVRLKNYLYTGPYQSK